ncbi:MAG: cytochrome-c peroxidase, partial [Telluria sp.]
MSSTLRFAICMLMFAASGACAQPLLAEPIRPLPLASGAGGVPNRFNTPTVYNSTFNFRQTWTGRHSTINGLLDHVITRPNGLASSWEIVASRLTGDDAMSKRFNAVYGDEVSPERLKDALGHYLKSLVTPSRFDRYLRGDKTAIS